ncbi:aldo/keto reductase [Halomicrobium sp. LC1Hm]|uniref:aldo/keto reductase n=1 Tax=Halomicrobium sp. LC1Hm TaxID=2610902 RepID=UPI00129837D5|nr:aldo/keto reductase [Halomicrobium sp. LC1Hm]QGA81444.1 Aldo/keto reductase, related to diketogulonate reductase [Halomicrobium sp. LC1Hm]
MEHVEAGGASIPKIGLGTWQNTGTACTETVRTALDLGYRHVDTAQVYDNERAVGEGIAAADVDRDDIFLTTKVWRSNLRREAVVSTVQESLATLGVDYVDLLLIHWPHPRVPVEEPLAAMAELRERGLVEHLGVSNFTRSQLRAAGDAVDAPIVADQVLYHPYKDQSALREYCVDAGVALTAYSPLARGRVLGDDLLARIGDRYDRTPAQVALRWLVQQDGVVAIPKSTSRDHLADNLAVFEFSLTDDEMARIHELEGGFKTKLRNRLPALMRRLPV